MSPDPSPEESMVGDMTERIAWIDLETTGLDERTCSVLEVGVIVTDWALNVVAERSWLVAHEGPVSAFIAEMHGPQGSGLLDLCAGAWTAHEADVLAASFVAKHAGERPILGGRNAHFDRRFLRARLPRLHDALSHRSLDLTTLWLAVDHWVAPVEKGPQHHRALPDLHRDLDEMRRYRALLGRLREVAP